MFTKILIANRGEIACRVIDTCRRLGVGTVAVHSDVDAGARHVAMADQAVSLGGAAPADSYLKGDTIIAAAVKTGAQAVHPGYGFLSENPEFVEAVEAAGLVFIGPSASAIRAMGLKDAAKDLMAEAGVPVVPGYQGAGQDPRDLAVEAEKIGYPLLIKAVAGGGGKGMRKVEAPAEFADALDAAQSEARKAFGNDHVLIEKWVTTPRHIEVQVFGDGEKAVHLFERDCSLQRRHQKVIEEAPAPGMTAEMRAAMGGAAVRAAEAIGYAGAGTVEFIVDASNGLRPDRFYFMEMNTRLQVEHPVTEAITGVDLVEWQLRVASGEGLPLRQEDLTITGHSFEARLYAEDAAGGFLPQTGTLTHLRFPHGARAETGVRAGDTISPWYDPMIAKLVTHGPTRATALLSLERALAQTQVAGTVTNLSFLRRLTQHAGFRAGDVDTGLIDRDVDTLAARPVPCSRARSIAALAALGLDKGQNSESLHLWMPLTWKAHLTWRDEDIVAQVVGLGGDRYRVTIDDAEHMVTRDGGWRVDGETVPAQVGHAPGMVHVFWGNVYSFDVPDPLAVAAGGGAASGVVLAPMPGLVKTVFVDAGAEVAAGARLIVLEAMKMEHTLVAPHDGTVGEVLAAAGDQVEAGAPLVRMQED
ncbi:acetyl-CoA carboxylase biotin carboxylase subunit [Jannaschia donghaensis]|uniref:Acetyl-/propionyl-coenzyme A carboxylase alpha chain n=1 Tax=Jannaschia donghaensis TaxID=420998 RepID=A0A0M6YK34_9RHOB|nr:acetyl/propionyl/methylcrotonyl-CoA carboxylase subunit alpha [Jannaschia donghaensis]CTQ49617.1 Acetyl-/propionyl-coenzyme A carboxylase alpha chain [Jannaschia donghaensis]